MAATHPSSPDTAAEATTGGNNAVKSAATSDDDATSSSAATSSQQSTNQKSNDMTHTTKSSPSPSPSSNTNNMPLPTYLSTKSSKAYTMSKEILSSGSLDDALSTLEMTLQLSREMLVSSFNNNNKNDNSTKPKVEENDVNIELHESLAPLYYLYGTTLLYSVEESDVMMAATNDQTKVTNGGAPSDIDVSPEEEDDDNMKLPSQDDEFVDASEQPSFGGFGEDYEEEHGAAEVQEISDPAEDLQIAWENLDLARTIVTRLVDEFKPSTNNNGTNNNNNNTVVLKSDEGNLKNDETLNPIEEIVNNGIKYTSTQQTNLLLDLAQIHTRLGDLQRANANILPCIDDYNLALELRTKCLGKFDKKVADSHFSLGQVYAEAPNRVGENEGMVSDFVNSLGGASAGSAAAASGGSNDGVELTEEEKIEMRSKSLEHYLACGVAFAGIMAKMCGEDAEKFTSFVNGESNGSGSAASAAVAAAKSSSSTSNSYAKTMTTVRERLSSLPQTNLSASAKEEFDDLKEMLDEIQEAMDTAEDTEEGLKTLGEMKANEIKKHEMKQNGEDGAVVETSEDVSMMMLQKKDGTDSAKEAEEGEGFETTPCPTLHEEQCDGGCWDKIRGTEYKSPHGIPLDLLDRLMI